LCLLIGGSFVAVTIVSSLLMYFPQAWPWILCGSIWLFGVYAFYDSRKAHYLNEYTSYKRHIK